eukprot:gene22025-29084_t
MVRLSSNSFAVGSAHVKLDNLPKEVHPRSEYVDVSFPFAALAVEYQITVTTSDIRNAGTDGDVFIQLKGPDGTVPETQLTGVTEPFERDMTNEFTIEGPDVGNVEEITLRLGQKDLAPTWHLASVEVENTSSADRSTFEHDGWLEMNDENPTATLVLQAEGVEDKADLREEAVADEAADAGDDDEEGDEEAVVSRAEEEVVSNAESEVADREESVAGGSDEDVEQEDDDFATEFQPERDERTPPQSQPSTATSSARAPYGYLAPPPNVPAPLQRGSQRNPNMPLRLKPVPVPTHKAKPSPAGSNHRPGQAFTFSSAPNSLAARPHQRADFSHDRSAVMKISYDNNNICKRLMEISGKKSTDTYYNGNTVAAHVSCG